MLENTLKQPKQFYIDQINAMCEPLKDHFDEPTKRAYARQLAESFDDYLCSISNEVFKTIELYRVCKKAIGLSK